MNKLFLTQRILCAKCIQHPRRQCRKFGWNWPRGSGGEDFYFVNIFLLFHNYLPLERAGPFIYSNLNSLNPRMHCAKFGWNWPWGSGEEDFFFRQCIFTISYLSPLGKERAYHLNKLESLSPKNTFAKFGWNWHSGSGEEDKIVKSLR